MIRKMILSLGILFLFACQPQTTARTIHIIDGDSIITVASNAQTPREIFTQAGLTFGDSDQTLLNGILVTLDQPLPETDSTTLQLRRPVSLTLITPQGEQAIRSSVFTVGEVLHEASQTLYAGDAIYPPPNTPIKDGMTITITPARDLTVSVDEMVVTIKSSAATVGRVLAEAGIPLLGDDYSLPSENEAVPADGQIKVVRVSESVLLAQKPIPFESELVASADVPLDQTQILQPGENGLSVERIRIRYEDGVEVSRITENETTVRVPKTRVLGYGTKIEIKTAVVDGVTLEYWRAVQMYATSYSPCRSGGDRCYTGTSSGRPLVKGLVGLRYSWYLAMGGQPLYVPGYGYATVADVCGGCVGKPWIDLGYGDADYVPWSSWVTVYFLTPVPSNIIYVLE
jgi:uncharacterized protein YabE (DUF348 family)